MGEYCHPETNSYPDNHVAGVVYSEMQATKRHRNPPRAAGARHIPLRVGKAPRGDEGGR